MGRQCRTTVQRFGGFERLEERVVLSAAPLITEFMASNAASLLDGDGNASDWVELYNPNATDINLGGWSLTDSANNPQKWTFPSVRLGAGDYLVVFASSETMNDYLDAAGYPKVRRRILLALRRLSLSSV